MSLTTAAVLAQIEALPDEERRELLAALPAIEKRAQPVEGLDKVYAALSWRYQGSSDDAARVDESPR